MKLDQLSSLTEEDIAKVVLIKGEDDNGTVEVIVECDGLLDSIWVKKDLADTLKEGDRLDVYSLKSYDENGILNGVRVMLKE